MTGMSEESVAVPVTLPCAQCGDDKRVLVAYEKNGSPVFIPCPQCGTPPQTTSQESNTPEGSE